MSNARLLDSTNRIEDILKYTSKIGLGGIALTDHESLMGAFSLLKTRNELREAGEIDPNMKVLIGDEAYLVDKEEVEKAREDNESVKYHHFLMVALNKHGYEGLIKLSSTAWENSYTYKGMQRTPLYYEQLEEVMQEYKGDIIASTACIGGFAGQAILSGQKWGQWLGHMNNIFGKENFYLELQPTSVEGSEQDIVNKALISAHKLSGNKLIVTTDAHYLNKEEAPFHEAFLKSQNGEREVAEFYARTYFHSYDELLECFDEELLEEMARNTMDVIDRAEEFEIAKPEFINQVPLPDYDLAFYPTEFDGKTPVFSTFYYSGNPTERYFAHLILQGFKDLNVPMNDFKIARMEEELDIVRDLGNTMEQTLASYFVMTNQLTNIYWEHSFVGVGRGSSSSFLINYLLKITQVDGSDYGIVPWRFLNKEKAEMPDIDEDTAASARSEIVEALQNFYGEDNVLNFATVSRVADASAIMSSARSFGLDVQDGDKIKFALPSDMGVEEAMETEEFSDLVNQHEGLGDTILKMKGLMTGVSVHASAVAVFDKPYYEYLPMMKTRNNVRVTQGNMYDVNGQGIVKTDALTIDAMDKLMETVRLLIEDGVIEDKGSLRANYDTYLHPDLIDLNQPELYDLISSGTLPSLFQFSTQLAQQIVHKAKPTNFMDLTALNSLLRMSADGEQPVDKWIRYRDNINEWYSDMVDYGLTEREQKILKNECGKNYGLVITQEDLMSIVMNGWVAGFTMGEANMMRKAVAKKKPALVEKAKALFYDKGDSLGNDKQFLDYVWEVLITPTLGYAFSAPHTIPYTMIALQEAYIAWKYGTAYWVCANINVDSGVVSGGSPSYDKIVNAVVPVKAQVLPPNINKSGIGFNVQGDMIAFGLQSLSKVNGADIDKIILNRPYTSLEDFVERSEVAKAKTITLISAGCFDEFGSRKEIMMQYVKLQVSEVTKITSVHLKHLLPMMPDNIMDLYQWTLDHKDDKKNKAYKDHIADLTEWMKSDETLANFTRVKRNNYWKDNIKLTDFAVLEVQAIGFGLRFNQADDKRFKIPDFNELPIHSWDDKEKYEEEIVLGVVLSENKTKGRLMCQSKDDHIFEVVIGKNKYEPYSTAGLTKKGQLLVFCGTRRNDTGFYASYRGHKVGTVGRDGIKWALNK
jgi:DNA polymerase-3 subunit alpha